MNKIWKTSGAILTALGACAAVAATPEQTRAVSARKANYKEIGGAFKSINDEIKSGAPSMSQVRPLARDIAQRAARVPGYFIPGSGPESGLNTRAKPAIWKERAKFTQLQQQMITAANEMNAAAIAGDVSRLTAARNTLGGLCKTCHERYKDQS